MSEKKTISIDKLKKLPYKELNKLIEKLRDCLRKDPIVKRMFKKYKVNIKEIDYIPMKFGDIDVSAKTNHGVITYSFKLLQDGNFTKDYSYGVHEITHWLQQTTGNKPTQGADDGEYLKNPYEQEGFQNQIEYISDHFGEDQAEEYVEQLLDYHKVQKKDKDNLESIFLENV